MSATVSEKKQLTETLKQRAHKIAKIKAEAEKMAEGLGDTILKIGAKAGEQGRIFGSVNTIQTADAIRALGFDVDRKSIKLKGEAIKALGKYEAEVTFHRDVVRTIPFRWWRIVVLEQREFRKKGPRGPFFMGRHSFHYFDALATLGCVQFYS